MKAFYILLLVGFSTAQWDPNFAPGRNAIVHLFEWRWNDIAEECERFLGPYGYGGVQVSPPTENAVITNPFRPWWERYQPISYGKFTTRSGTAEEFSTMVRRCNNVGVRIYVDTIINHLTGSNRVGKGTAGSDFNAPNREYPAFSRYDFNDNRCTSNSGDIEDWNDPNQYRNCKLSSLVDLNQEAEYVREQLVKYLNRLIDYGVAGFRVDAAKHMWPSSLKVIFDSLHDLPVDHGFVPGSRAFVYQEVIELGSSKAIGMEYYHLGRVTEFRYGAFLGNILRGNDKMKYLSNFGTGWGMHDNGNALVFIDNHDNQRGHGGGGDLVLTFRDAKMYKMATAFMLAHPYGITRIMSSYYWEQRWEGGSDKNDWVGPPRTDDGSTLPVIINPDLTCGNGWICEHRWRQIYNMVKFRNVVAGTNITNWWDNDNNQIAFCRGDKGFIAINNDNHALSASLQTCLPAGRYCDRISGSKENNSCTGAVITVNSGGRADIHINNDADDPVIAIDTDSKI